MADSRDAELVITPGTYAYVLNGTTGQVGAYVGPHKSSLSATDTLVMYNAATRRFDPTTNQQVATQNNIMCPKGCYMMLENPARDRKQPESGKTDVVPPLQFGRIENLPGPQFFALWPGQIATVVKGHHLRSNQYLMVRIADDEAAKENWGQAVVKRVAEHPTSPGQDDPEKTATATAQTGAKSSGGVLGIDTTTLVTGQLIIVRGTDVAFYIPPTGVEVLTDDAGNYVRDAETLERLEYAILLDEDGNKEYKKGPDVVFPTPTQQFYTRQIRDSETGKISTQRKFRAFELQPTNGVHVKVIADYEDGEGKHKAGDERFITGKTVAIYYPREEDAIMTYGGNEKSYAVAIPPGEGRYVLDRLTGVVKLITGPDMFLPNPIKEVIVRRILNPSECELYFPGNREVARFNASLNENSVDVASDPVAMTAAIARNFTPARRERTEMMEQERGGSGGTVADRLVRSTVYTPPRMITLNTKFDGAVRIDVWSGFAVQVVNSKGDRKTVIGPQTVLLEYDEYLEPMSLSTGKPKSDDNRIRTPYLRYLSNPVSDVVSLKTLDLVDVDIQVKYLIRFEEKDSSLWFTMDNYVQYMVDHLRSMIGNAVRNISVQEFHTNAANILRDVVLGKKPEDGDRPLKKFAENGMTVYDLELITVVVRDRSIAELLSKSRQDTLAESIALERARAQVTHVTGMESAVRDKLNQANETTVLRDKLNAEEQQREAAAVLERVINLNKKSDEEAKGQMAIAKARKAVEDLLLEIDRNKRDVDELYKEAENERTIKLDAETANAHKVRMEALAPKLVEAFVGLSQSTTFEAMAEHLAPLALVRDESLVGTLHKLVKGTPLEHMLGNLQNLSSIGRQTS